MWSYSPPFRDMRFVMDELLDVRRDWAQMPCFADLDASLAPQILEEAGKFAQSSLAPLNARGDLEGCRYDAGAVSAPPGFRDAYRRFVEAGWPSLACDPATGGQGLPQLLNAALYEMLFAANHAWAMYPGLAHGAYECLRTHAAPWIQALYLPKIVSGEWLSTMCLTEPQAGSDVGLVRTRADPLADGSFALTGSKIFISGGEHDLTDNIVHLVLARLPDSPVGSRGISLFLVPKVLPGEQGSRRNAVHCQGIEKKMGIKGSATCAMSFDAATGWLIGEPNRGLPALFVMMNSARLSVGLQGLGHAEMAFQNAVRYARERLQMRAAVKPADCAAPRPGGADPIALQPAVRRNLMTQRAMIEGERALGYWAAHLLDVAAHHADERQRAAAHDRVSLLTPIIKSFFTDNGFRLSSAALQVWGGYGFIQEFGVEQTVRDSRIAMIYEGTNEIQAIDLLVRKVSGDGGRNFAALLAGVREEADRSAGMAACEAFGVALRGVHDGLAAATDSIVAEAARQPETVLGAAEDFLHLTGLCLLGSQWSHAARIAAPRTAEPFYAAKMETARFYFDFVLPEADHRLNLLSRRARPLPWIRTPE